VGCPNSYLNHTSRFFKEHPGHERFQPLGNTPQLILLLDAPKATARARKANQIKPGLTSFSHYCRRLSTFRRRPTAWLVISGLSNMHARRLETIPLNPLRFLENSLLDLIGGSLIGWPLIDNRWMLKQPDQKQTLQTSLNTRNLNNLRGPGNNMSSQTLRLKRLLSSAPSSILI
jgi:hypothetical protein